jgi:hypothetical protein
MTDTAPTIATPVSRKKLLIGSAVALTAAAVALVVFILPAEYGIDPTGAGEALGVTKLADTGEEENIYLKRGLARTNVLFPLDAAAEPNEETLRATLEDKGIAVPADAEVRTDRYTFELLPYEGIEMKYVLAEGAPMVFSWRTAAPVNVDMHSHPFEGGTEATESFVIEDLSSQTAVYVAPFTGIHGWYWQNRTLENVTLTLDATGAFTGSKIFDQTGEHDRALAPPSD